MTDLSKLSDEELKAQYKAHQSVADMSDDELKAAHSAAQPSVAADVAKSTAIAVPQTAISLAGLPGTASDYIGRGVNALGNLVTGKSGSYEDYQKKRATALGGADIAAPTTQAIQSTVEKATGPFYEPKTMPGQIANAATGSALTAMLFPGKLATNALLGAGTGLASESAGQVADAYAPKAGPAARVGTAVLAGGVGAAIPNTLTRRATSAARPTIDDLRTGGSGAFQAVDNMGVTLDPSAVSSGLGGVKTALRSDFGSAKEIKPVTKMLGAMEDATAPSSSPAMTALTGVRPAVKAPVNVSDLQDLRSSLGKLAATTQDRMTGLAAREAQSGIDDFLAKIDPKYVLSGDAKAAVAKLGEARDYWSAMKRAEISAGRLDLGDLNAAKAGIGTNIGNAERQSIGALVRPNMKGEIPAKKFGFNEPEIAQANKVARGEGVDNLLRRLGGGTIGHGVLGGGGLFEFYRTGDPSYLAPYMAATGLKRLSGAMTKSKARVFDEMVRSRSPGGPFKYNVTPPPGRLTTGATGALLGAQTGNLLLNDPYRR